ncbi:glycoside hydrolase family 127 protein [Paenibacillus fonticola]|uniref:glycoside hydrolase family 127 protein n=1 Tax=Paenibacillus fonticola TaxID=379896 RepID=UPI00036E2906|nr:beta-L-arabinofuranosidase domain-containing protein [Paenibacillus fonticola]
MNKVHVKKIDFADNYWYPRMKQMAEQVIPYQWSALNDQIPGAEPSHAIENFRIAAGETDGKFHGMVFQDSDVAKWIEAASFSLQHTPNAELEQIIDAVVDLMERAQQEDGYLNTYFTVAAPEQRWKDQSFGHELYCAGHLIEAAVAYFEATKKRKFLDIMCRYVDLIDRVIGPEADQLQIYDGHEEIELALVKLYRVTKEDKHLKLSQFFVNERGKQPSFLESEPTFGNDFKDRWFALDYHQAHAPVREQETAEGHAVRAMYLYSAMADLALLTGDTGLKNALIELWKHVTTKRMYVTGGLGSQGHAERFTVDYDLPNDTAYTETCAAIGLIMWAVRMLQLEPNREYADVMERALYNGALSGISLDGTKYFYVNPLEVHPQVARYRYDMKHVEPERVPWFGCACCPPNIARLISSLDRYIYTTAGDSVYVHLYAAHECKLEVDGQQVGLVMDTRYPWEGHIAVQIHAAQPVEFDLCLRLPAWAPSAKLRVNDEAINVPSVIERGYIKLRRQWREGDRVTLQLPMSVQRIASHPKVHENAGKVALQRGPVVYCLEEVDNGADLTDIRLNLSSSSDFKAEYRDDLLGGVVIIRAEGERSDLRYWEGKLYDGFQPAYVTVPVVAVPYAHWGNRKPGEMLVWMRQG